MGRPRKPLSETIPSVYKGADGLWHARFVMGLKPDGTTDRKHVRRKDKTDPATLDDSTAASGHGVGRSGPKTQRHRPVRSRPRASSNLACDRPDHRAARAVKSASRWR